MKPLNSCLAALLLGACSVPATAKQIMIPNASFMSHSYFDIDRNYNDAGRMTRF